MIHKHAKCFFLFAHICLVFSLVWAQSGESSLDRGILLYSERKWQDAAASLRLAEADTALESRRAEILYWIALAEMGEGKYEEAVRELDKIASVDAKSSWGIEAQYHKGRCLYYLGSYDDAIIVLKEYADIAAGDAMKTASAFYWVGECLFSLGQFDLAQDVFYRIIDEFPESVKYEAAGYRIALINQKKVEAELLAMLKWSHEESLKTVEVYQRRERSYDQAIIAYQKRIADMQNVLNTQQESE